MKFLKGTTYIFILLLAACGGNKPDHDGQDGSKTNTNVQQPKISPGVIKLENAKSLLQLGDKFLVSFQKTDTSRTVDSILVYYQKQKITCLKKAPFKVEIDTRITGHVGVSPVKMVIYTGDDKFTEKANVTVLADSPPARYGFNIKETFPHDKNAYTQGLVYEHGFLYEGTGQWGGKSSIRKVKLETGEVVKYLTMAPELFGEGISVIGNRIFQVTYKARMGFIYDKDSFKELGRFSYTPKEGWGLTFDGEYFIMSDGTNILHYMDTSSFAKVKQLQVYNHEGMVDSLNELEFINGIIYANLYQSDIIVMIDPGSGKVIGRADMKGLLANEHKHPDIDVLNGIAYDNMNKRIFVTGKNWPVLFELDFVKN